MGRLRDGKDRERSEIIKRRRKKEKDQEEEDKTKDDQLRIEDRRAIETSMAKDLELKENETNLRREISKCLHYEDTWRKREEKKREKREERGEPGSVEATKGGCAHASIDRRL